MKNGAVYRAKYPKLPTTTGQKIATGAGVLAATILGVDMIHHMVVAEHKSVDTSRNSFSLSSHMKNDRKPLTELANRSQTTTSTN